MYYKLAQLLFLNCNLFQSDSKQITCTECIPKIDCKGDNVYPISCDVYINHKEYSCNNKSPQIKLAMIALYPVSELENSTNYGNKQGSFYYHDAKYC